MAENETPPKAPEPQIESAPVAASGYDEFGTAKRTLPPALPVAIALILVGIAIAVIAYTQRAKPAAQGTVDGQWFSQPANMDSPMVLIAVTIRNVSDKTLYIKGIKATVQTDKGDQSDDAASASDYERYLQAYPDLRGHGDPLKVETKIPPGGEQKGTVMVTFPVTPQLFEGRKDLIVTIEPYDQKSVELHEKVAAVK
jgi:hypothetical protein